MAISNSAAVSFTHNNDQPTKDSYVAKAKSQHKTKTVIQLLDSTEIEQETFSIKPNLDSDVIRAKYK